MDLVVRLSALGDIIHTAIILQFLPNKVDWLVEEGMAEILEFNPNINKIQKVNLKSLKKSKMNIFSEYKKLKKFHYDRAIDFQGLIKSAIVSKIVANEVIGREEIKEKIAKIFYSKTIKTNLHTIDRYRIMINEIYGLNVSKEEFINHKPFLFYEEEDFVCKEYFLDNKKNVIFIVGASGDYKIYPKERWIEIANSLKENILIPYGNEEEKEIAEFIAKNSQYVKVLPKQTLNQLKATISNSDLVIGNDTGPTYIGWANKIPTILIYGAVEANKVYENKITKFIKSTNKTNPLKVNKKDFSIKKVKSDIILRKIDEIFS